MTSISPTDLLIARLQGQLGASSLSLTKRKHEAGASSVPSAGGASKAQTRTPERLLEKRIAAIDATDPDRRRKVFRAFLEVTLLTEFGEHVINDPAFYHLVDEVHEAMASDNQLRPHIEQAVDMLERLV